MSQYGITWRMMPALALHWDASITCVQPPPSASSQQTFCEGTRQSAMLAMFTSHKSIHKARHCVMTPSNCQTWTLDKRVCFTFPAMASSSRPEKLAKLQHFKANLPFHSQSSLHAMIEEAKEMGLPDFSTPKHQREARRQTIAECHGGDLGPLIQETVLQNNDGEPVPFVFTSLLTYLMALFARGGSWAQLFSSVHAKCPSSPQQPWKLIVYLDELVPGNVLGRAERKSWAWYCSFLELGNHLSSIHSWLTIALARSTKVSKLEAAVSQITASLLKSIFCNPLSFPQTGIILKDPKTNTTIRFHFDFGMILADGAAQKQVWGSKGDGGSKFCFLCKNVRASGTTEANMHSNITKYNQLDLASDQDVLQSYATLHSRKKHAPRQILNCGNRPQAGHTVTKLFFWTRNWFPWIYWNHAANLPMTQCMGSSKAQHPFACTIFFVPWKKTSTSGNFWKMFSLCGIFQKIPRHHTLEPFSKRKNWLTTKTTRKSVAKPVNV